MSDLLARLQALPSPIPFVLAGCGSAGKGILYQSMITPGVRCLGVADVDPGKAWETARALGLEPLAVDSEGGLAEAVRRGRLAVCEDAGLLARSEAASVFLDASSALAEAAAFDAEALRRGKHLVMMNSEADLAFGPWFLELARRRGVVYTSCDGDQPAALMRLHRETSLWGFQTVMAGNIKGYLRRSANPVDIVPEAAKRGLDPKMCAAYTDGTKLGVEQALIANALGLRTAAPGMLGPRTDDLMEVFDLFDFASLWRDRIGLTDYVLGPRPKGGVFLIGFNEDPYQKSMLDWFPSETGPGPFYLFSRPYHLVHIEAMATVAEAVLDGEAILAPWKGFRTDVYAYAKRGLRSGQSLDGIGGHDAYGLIENCADQAGREGLPMTLSEGLVLKRDVAQDERILWSDVEIPGGRADVRAYDLAREASRRLDSGSV